MPVEVARTGDPQAPVAVLTYESGPLNLYTLDLHDAFDRALDSLSDERARVLVVRARGKVVSGGVDVAQFAAQPTRADTQVLYDRMMELPQRFADLPIPTVFVSHGLTLTWALEVALACDVLFAAQRAKFGLVERVIGLTPTMGGTQRFAARAGVARAKEFVFSGDLYDAETLERWNVVNRVVADDDLDAAVDAFAQHLAVGPTRAFGAAKDILRAYEADGVTGANAVTTQIASELFDTEDLQHGMASFLTDGPGKATFHGR